MGTARSIVMNVKEEKFFLYPLRFSIWGPVNQTDHRQVSRRKDRVYLYMRHAYTRGLSDEELKGMVRIGGLYTILIGTWEEEKGTCEQMISSRRREGLKARRGKQMTFGKINELLGE